MLELAEDRRSTLEREEKKKRHNLSAIWKFSDVPPYTPIFITAGTYCTCILWWLYWQGSLTALLISGDDKTNTNSSLLITIMWKKHNICMWIVELLSFHPPPPLWKKHSVAYITKGNCLPNIPTIYNISQLKLFGPAVSQVRFPYCYISYFIWYDAEWIDHSGLLSIMNTHSISYHADY